MYKTPAYDQFLLLTNDFPFNSRPPASARRPFTCLALRLPSIAFALYESGRLVLRPPTQIQHLRGRLVVMK